MKREDVDEELFRKTLNGNHHRLGISNRRNLEGECRGDVCQCAEGKDSQYANINDQGLRAWGLGLGAGAQRAAV